MKHYRRIVMVVLAVSTAALAQTTNGKYEVTFFGAPPPGQDVWNLPRSVAADASRARTADARYAAAGVLFSLMLARLMLRCLGQIQFQYLLARAEGWAAGAATYPPLAGCHQRSRAALGTRLRRAAE